MTITKDLQATTQKSYYGKAKMLYTYLDDELIAITLKSYNTEVLTFTPFDLALTKEWNGYSRTTVSHINDFIDFINSNYEHVNIHKFNKKSWLEFQKSEFTNDKFIVIGSNGFCEYKAKTIFDTYNQAQKYADSLNEKSTLWSYWVEYTRQ